MPKGETGSLARTY